MDKLNAWLIRATSAAVALAPMALRAQEQAEPYRYELGPHGMWWGGGYGMFFGPLFMVVLLAAVTVVAVLLVRWIGGPRHEPTGSTRRTPLDILKERFARGEIDKGEFDERRRVLDA